jgi:hypothetical protein
LLKGQIGDEINVLMAEYKWIGLGLCVLNKTCKNTSFFYFQVKEINNKKPNQSWPFIYKPGEHRQQSKGGKNTQHFM